MRVKTVKSLVNTIKRVPLILDYSPWISWQLFTLFYSVVSDLNWTIVIPLMACLLVSLMVNIILFCRLKKRKHEYSLQEKPGQQIIEGAVVKSSEKQKIEPGVDRTWLLCRRSADVTEV